MLQNETTVPVFCFFCVGAQQGANEPFLLTVGVDDTIKDLVRAMSKKI